MNIVHIFLSLPYLTVSEVDNTSKFQEQTATTSHFTQLISLSFN